MFGRAKKPTAAIYDNLDCRSSERNYNSRKSLVSPPSSHSYSHTSLLFTRNKSSQNLLRPRPTANSMVINRNKPTGRLSERNSPQLKSDFSFSNGSNKHGQQGKTNGGVSSGDEITLVRYLPVK